MAIAYPYDGVLYLAVTRKCTLRCTFCPKTHGRWVVAGNDLQHDEPPTTAELLAAAEKVGLEKYKNVAFVGLGEPTIRLPIVCEVGRELRKRGHHVRMVTDGLASKRAGRDVTPELEGCLDEVHVSLNAPDAATYAKLCPNPYGEDAHAAVCDFIRQVKQHVPTVMASVIAMPEVDLAASKQLCAELGVPLRVRAYFDPLEGEPHEHRTKG